MSFCLTEREELGIIRPSDFMKKGSIRHLKFYIDKKDLANKLLTLVCVNTMIVGAVATFSHAFYYHPQERPWLTENVFCGNEIIIEEEAEEDILKELEQELNITIEQNEDDYLLLNAIRENPYLTNREKDTFYRFADYFQDNPYLDKEKVYERLLNVNTRFALRGNLPVGENTLAVYLPEYHDIVYFQIRYDEDTMLHEDGHSIQDNEKIPDWFLEGMDQLIVLEYTSDQPFVLTEVYPYQVTMVKLLCDLVGSDTVLKAYTTDDPELLYEALEKVYGKKEDAERTLTIFGDIVEHKTEIPKEDILFCFSTLSTYVLQGMQNDAQAVRYHYYVLASIFSEEAGTFEDNTKYTLEKAYLSSKLKKQGYDQAIVLPEAGYQKKYK